MLARLIGPGPFPGGVAVDELGRRRARRRHLPGREPALAVERARIALHVRPQHDLAAAEGEAAAADAVGERDEREAAMVEHAPLLALDPVQTRYSFATRSAVIETGDAAAEGGGQLKLNRSRGEDQAAGCGRGHEHSHTNRFSVRKLSCG